MRLLFAITVCCFLAVLWIALALARRIRLAQLLQMRPAHRPAAASVQQEFFEAGEFRTPRPLRLEQEILKQRPRRHLSEVSFPHNPSQHSISGPALTAELAPAEEPLVDKGEVPQAKTSLAPQPASRADLSELRPPSRTQPIPIRPATAYASLFGQTVEIARIGSNPRTMEPEVLTPDAEAAISNAARKVAPVEFTLHRRPPQSAKPSGLRRRIDLSHYNSEMGDLTDPYTNPLRGSGTQGPVPKYRDDF